MHAVDLAGWRDTRAIRAAKVPIVWVLGGPGCGKGTQCGKIVEKYGFTHLSTGTLLRDDVETGSARGKEIKELMAKGELVPMIYVLEMLAEAMLAHLSESNGFLIDGYPRDVTQAEMFEQEIAPCSTILYFELSDDVMKQRILHRAKTSGRDDDNEATIAKRITTFHKHSEPVVQSHGKKLCKIPANRSIEDIFGDVCQEMDRL